MNISLDNIGKKYGREWIFRNFSMSLSNERNYVVLGSNGSGKSTLLKILSGFLSPSEGTINYEHQDKIISVEDIYKKVSYTAPYIDVFEHLTLQELYNYQKKLKPFLSFEENNLAQLLQLEGTDSKRIKNFSSGMKQRLKLGLAILSESPILLLDEPTSNLDEKGKKWYAEMIENYAKNKLIVVASNSQKDEYFFCQEEINIEDFK